MVGVFGRKVSHSTGFDSQNFESKLPSSAENGAVTQHRFRAKKIDGDKQSLGRAGLRR